MPKFQRHLFVCTNDRGPDNPRGSCAQKGSRAIVEALKEAAYEHGLKRIVRVNSAGCLDQCARGVTVVVYPEATWYGGVTLADVAELVERHLVRGETVERLVIPDAELTGLQPPRGGAEPVPQPGGEAAAAPPRRGGGERSGR